MNTGTLFPKVRALLDQAALDGSIPASQLVIRKPDKVVFSCAAGWTDPEIRQNPVNKETLFDLASITKLFTTTAFMRLVTGGSFRLDQPVSNVLPEFSGWRESRPFEEPLEPGKFRDVSADFAGPVDASKITFRQILTHTSGLPAWLPLFREENALAARNHVLQTSFSYQPDSDVVYSDLGFLLLGWAIEKASGLSLEQSIQKLVLTPLRLPHSGYRPLDEDFHALLPLPSDGAAPTGICRWRNRRLNGEVDDENSAFLHGVSGHAGLFGTAEDLAAFGSVFLMGSSFLPATAMDEMTRSQAISKDGLMNRGLGFQRWSPDPTASFAPLSRQTFGHTGFTGTALWIDPQRELVIALLTNEVYNGRFNRKIAPFRLEVSKTILEEMEK